MVQKEPHGRVDLPLIASALMVLLLSASGAAYGAKPLPGGVLAPGGLTPMQHAQAPPGGGRADPRRVSSVAPDHILVELAPEADQAPFLEAARGQGLRKIRRLHGTRWLVMAIPSQAPGGPRAMAAAARALPGVLRASADPVIVIDLFPNDPLYVDDPAPEGNFDPDQWGLFQVQAESGWAVTMGIASVIIAVIDSGVDLDHDDLFAKTWTNPGETPGNGVDDDGNGYVDDIHGWDFSGVNLGAISEVPVAGDNNPDVPEGGVWVQDSGLFCDIIFGCWRFEGDAAVGDLVDNNGDGYYDVGVPHGTIVAGIAGAMTDNLVPDASSYEGMAGACPGCTLMPLRIINAEGIAFGSDAAEAVRYAADNGADIINASWGIPPGGALPGELDVLTDAVRYAAARGVTLAAAAGNSGEAGLHFPASMIETIAVGSSTAADTRSWFSSYADPAAGDVLDVVAPGEYIWSTYVVSPYDAWILNGWPLLDSVFDPNDPEASGYPPPAWLPGIDAYSMADGTSFAAPLVSGYLGLVLSHNPCAAPDDLRAVLRGTAVDVGASGGYDAETGFGRLRMHVPDLGLACDPDANEPPQANAGPDQTIQDKGKPGEVVTLDGSASFDPDGSILSYEWREEGGTPLATGEIVSITLGVGVHTIELTVTDDNQATGTDDVVVTVNEKSGGGAGGGTPDKPGKPPKN